MNFQPIARADGPSGQPDIRQRARSVAATLFEAAGAADAAARIEPDTLDALHAAGLAMAPFPARWGGEDLAAPARHDDLAAVLRTIGWGDLAVGRVFEGHVNAIALVCRYGSDRQIETLAGAVADREWSAVWGVDGADGLRAEPTGPGWRLNGRKILASGTGFVTRPVVAAKAPAGQVMLLPRLRPGERVDVSGWTVQGMRSTATGAVDFSTMALDADQLLGIPGDFTRQPAFAGGAWRFCAVHLGGIERLVDLFREHLRARKRDGDPYQLHRIGQCVAAAMTAALWVDRAAKALADADDTATIVAFANLTRVVTERAALDVLEAVHRGVGLDAFMRPNPIERISRDLSTYLRQPVPDLAMADAARTVLASPRSAMDLWTPAFANRPTSSTSQSSSTTLGNDPGGPE